MRLPPPPPRTRFALPLLPLLLLAVSSAPLGAQVAGLEILSREPVLGGRDFGTTGAYEKITGRIRFGLDPGNPFNARIVDLDKAPRSSEGRVSAWAEFQVLQPLDPARGRRMALLEVSNRGGKAALGYFNRGRFSLDPKGPEEFGDGLLQRLGLTLIWVGWQADVPDRPGLLRLRVPTASDPDGPITGLVRSDWVVDQPAVTLALAHRGHQAYPVLDPGDPANVLTVRDGREAPRTVVPRDSWSFSRATASGLMEDRTHISLEGGFQAGKIYEMVYRAKDPRVVGMGLAAIRDTMSFALHDPDCPFPVKQGLAVGISQTGRFLRHFLYQGFNTDTQGRQVFDGMLVLTAGAGRGSFNHRFAQPSRDAHRYSAFFYPTDIFPFTSRLQEDPVTGRMDGLFAHQFQPDHLPRIFFINNGYEYWGRAAALIHTSVDGERDFPPTRRERIYHLCGAQHFPGWFPPRSGDAVPGTRLWRGNPFDTKTLYRALLVRLVKWVGEDKEPPASSFPHLEDGTLVPVGELALPAIPGMTAPHAAHVAYRANYGPLWSRGIVSLQPPVLGPAFPSRVPQVDALGNERGGVRGLELRVPLATYLPWNLRRGMAGGNGELTDFLGTFAPLPRTEEEKRRAGDPRPSLDVLYGDRAGWEVRARKAAQAQVREGFLLEEDVPFVLEEGRRTWDWIEGRKP